ncbi:MAG: guanylate kinase [Gammaproteobacteria bacterium]|nr:MAG: guanylate kinase [Gammaproteobacteria bacterium]
MAGTLYILSAPSGGGKSSLAQALVESSDDVGISVSHTTRAPRPGERNGVHYHFVDKETFEAMVAAGDFLEYAQVFDHYYGTTRAAVESLLAQGKNVLLDIDWQGMRGIKAQLPEAKSIFILPPSREELENRLRSRGQDSDEIIARRMRDAVSEMRHYDEFDYVLVNDDFDLALRDLRAFTSGQPDRARAVDIEMDALLHQDVAG